MIKINICLVIYVPSRVLISVFQNDGKGLQAAARGKGLVVFEQRRLLRACGSSTGL